MGNVSAADAGRAAILAAVAMQAIGKVTYGTALTQVPAPLFVFVSFSLTAALFLPFSRKGAGEAAWASLVVLNVSTAVTFLSFFLALKLIEPAIAVAVNIGVGPLLAVLIAWCGAGERPSRHRLLICAGVLLGCAALCLAAIRGDGFASTGANARLGLAASAIAGVGSVLVTVASRSLMQRGWRPGAVLAHRFHLVVPVSLALSLGADAGGIGWTPELTLTLLAVAVAGVLVPLYLLQFGIRRCDPYTVMVTMAALPILTFLVGGLSSAYEWSWMTAVGILIVSGFLMADVVRGKSA